MSSAAAPNQQREANPTDWPPHEPKTQPRRQLVRYMWSRGETAAVNEGGGLGEGD